MNDEEILNDSSQEELVTESELSEDLQEGVTEPVDADDTQQAEESKDKEKFLARLRSERKKREMAEARVAALEKEKLSFSERASLADEAVEALASQRGITEAEARALLREESRKMLKQHAPERQRDREISELQELRMKLERRELLDDAPEAKEVMDEVMEVAKATGQSIKDVYDRRFRKFIERLGSAEPNKKNMKPSQSFRGSDEDLSEDSTQNTRVYQKHMEAFHSSWKQPSVAKEHLRQALKAKIKISGRGS